MKITVDSLILNEDTHDYLWYRIHDKYPDNFDTFTISYLKKFLKVV